MKRFEFRLERVLKWKQQQEKLAELQQRQAQAVVDRARVEVARLKDQLAQTAVSLEEQLGGVVDTASWIALYAHSARLGQAIEVAKQCVLEMEKHLHDANARRSQLATEVEALLHLRGRQWQAHLREAALDEQRQLDELSLRRWRVQIEESATERSTGEGDLS